MAEPFIGEIKMIGFSYAPRYWAECYGQTMAVKQNQVLFALIRNQFGGDGTNTFCLPDMRGRTPIHPSGYTQQGRWGGAETVALQVGNLPEHRHVAEADSEDANTWGIYSTTAPNRALGKTLVNIYGDPTNLTALHPLSVGDAAGGSVPHNNMQPSLVLKFIIALQGTFPARS